MRLALGTFRIAPLFVVAALVLAALAPSANAQRNCPGGGSNSPPGNSEVDQYSENVPGPCGDQPVSPPPGGPDAPGSSTLPSGTVDDLNSLGPDGQAAAALAQSTGPRNGGATEDLLGGGADGGSSLGAADSGDSLFESIVDAITGSAEGEGGNGLGLILPLILAAILIAAIAYGLRRRLAE